MIVLVTKTLQKLDLRPTEWGIGNRGKRRAQKENRTGEWVGDGGTGEQGTWNTEETWQNRRNEVEHRK